MFPDGVSTSDYMSTSLGLGLSDTAGNFYLTFSTTFSLTLSTTFSSGANIPSTRLCSTLSMLYSSISMVNLLWCVVLMTS